VSVTELAALLNVSPPSVSTMVDRLVERGLLTRTPMRTGPAQGGDPGNAWRAEDIAQVEEVILGSFVELVDAVGPETTQKWCEVLQQVSTVLDGKESTFSFIQGH
jgi:DNA-binding Lrp family transcriptional regulator